MNQTALPPVPAGFTADSWPLFVVNGLRCRHEYDQAEAQDATAGVCSTAMTEVTRGTGQLLWAAMVPDGTKFVGSVVDADGDERPFVLTEGANGRWRADVTVAQYKLPRGYKTAIKAIVADPLGSAACANPAYVPTVLAHYGMV